MHRKMEIQNADQCGLIVKVTALTLFILYLSGLFYLTFLSQFYGRGYFHRSMNLVPFSTVFLFLSSGYARGILINIFGNVAAFVPMGLLLPLVSGKTARLFNVLLFACGISLFVEIVQYTLAVGAADIDDLILNMAGSLTGYGLHTLGRRLYRRIARPCP